MICERDCALLRFITLFRHFPLNWNACGHILKHLCSLTIDFYMSIFRHWLNCDAELVFTRFRVWPGSWVITSNCRDNCLFDDFLSFCSCAIEFERFLGFFYRHFLKIVCKICQTSDCSNFLPHFWANDYTSRFDHWSSLFLLLCHKIL